MKVDLTQPTVTLTLSIDEATDLYNDLEDVHDAPSGPGLERRTIRLMGELGATLEDGGYLSDEDDDPDDPEPIGNVISIDFHTHHGDPSSDDWRKAFGEAWKRSHGGGIRA